jgi:transcriptional regulator with XRE-family HTH domain
MAWQLLWLPVPFPSQRKYARKREPAIRRTLRSNLRNRRRALNLTARQLAEMIGVRPQWIHALESPRGTAVPGLFQLEQLAMHLGCLPADLLVPAKFTGDIDPDDDLRGRRK